MENNNIIEFKPNQSNWDSQDLEKLAIEEIWSGMRNYLKMKSTPVDARTDIYYMTYAHMLGILCFAHDEINHPKSSSHAAKIVSAAVINAIDEFNNESHSKRSQSN